MTSGGTKFKGFAMRKKFIAGNWKMYTDGASGEALAAAVTKGAAGTPHVQVAVCPPFPYLSRIVQAVRGTAAAVGAQNCYPLNEGAFTGEVSPKMLVDVGCQYVILGHSERRQMGETDAFINQKVHAALAAGLKVILCIGETLAERDADRTKAVLEAQLTGSLLNLDASQMAKIVLAYEPVWAIGTGRNAEPAQAQEEHVFIRTRISAMLGADAAQKVIIQYGGSVKPQNAAALLAQPDIDGALVGGASLKADDFLAILAAAPK